MKVSLTRLVWIAVPGVLLVSLLLWWWLFYNTGLSDFAYLRLMVPAFTMLLVLHYIVADRITDGYAYYNREVLRHLLKRLLFWAVALAILSLLVYAAYKIEGGIGAGYLAFFLLVIIATIYYSFIVIEAIVLLYKRKFRKAYCNLVIAVISLVYCILLF